MNLKKQKNIALFPLSADPITNGHIDIIKRASLAFDELIVAIGKNGNKKYLLPIEKRVALLNACFKDDSNIKIKTYLGLLPDFARENNIHTIIRGIRNKDDLEYEHTLQQTCKGLCADIDVFLLITDPKFSHISSSLVKMLLFDNAFIHEYVPLVVKQSLEENVLGRFIIGITGEIGAGKTYISNKLVDIAKAHNLEAHNIELDNLGHDILNTLDEPFYRNLRQDLIEIFGHEITLDGNFIDRKILGKIVFNDKKLLNKLNSLMKEAILIRLRQEITNKKGLILINGALLSEFNMTNYCNNNIVLIETSVKLQTSRLKKRDFSDEQIQRRIESQYTTQKKLHVLQNSIKQDNYGTIIKFLNENATDEEINDLYLKIKKFLNINQ